jgi:hypothetical protein
MAISVTWTALLASYDVQRHRTSKRELDEMRAVVARDLADSQLGGLSTDRRFATAFDAALQTASMAIAFNHVKGIAESERSSS